MLSNAYFLAKFRFDTAENEPAKILPFWCDEPEPPFITPKCVTGLAGLLQLPQGWEGRGLGAEVLLGEDLRPSAPGSWHAAISRGLGVSKIGKFYKILQIFSGLVLGCIKTKFCKKICV